MFFYVRDTGCYNDTSDSFEMTPLTVGVRKVPNGLCVRVRWHMLEGFNCGAFYPSCVVFAFEWPQPLPDQTQAIQAQAASDAVRQVTDKMDDLNF